MGSGTYIWQKDLMQVMQEATAFCVAEISKHSAPGNSKVRDKLQEYKWTCSYITEHQPKGPNHSPAFVTLGDEVISIIKGALLFYAAHLKGERDHVEQTANVEGATEDLDRKLQFIDDFTRSKGLEGIKPDQFLKPPTVATPAHQREPIITDPELAKTVRGLVDHDDGTNDRAINDACVILETRIRDLAGLDKGDFGKRLIDKSFRVKDGLLMLGDTDQDQEGWWRLYDGFFQSFRNPTGHSRVSTSRTRAAQIIGMADYLVCQLSEAKKRAAPKS